MERTHEHAVGILGAGGQANETESYIKEADVVFRAVGAEYVNKEDERSINIVSPEEYQRMLPVVAAIGAPAVRRDMVQEWPGNVYHTVIAETAYVDSRAELGDGVVIAPRAVVTTDVVIGNHVIVNVGATVSHNCKLGDFVTIGPGAHIAGNVTLGEGVFIGIGAIVSNDVEVANGCVIGAGAVVLKSITQENSVVVGAPSKQIRVNEGWLREI